MPPMPSYKESQSTKFGQVSQDGQWVRSQAIGGWSRYRPPAPDPNQGIPAGYSSGPNSPPPMSNGEALNPTAPGYGGGYAGEAWGADAPGDGSGYGYAGGGGGQQVGGGSPLQDYGGGGGAARPRDWTSYVQPPPAGAGGGGAGVGAAWSSPAEQELRRQRDLMLGTLAEGRSMWGSGTNDLLLNRINESMQGNNVPYTDAVQARLFSQRADAIAAQQQQQAAALRRQMAGAGMSGGGGELAMLLAQQQAAAGQRNNALADIGMQSALENYGAQERARDAAFQYLTGRAAAEAPFRLAEANARGRFEVTGVGPGLTQPGLFSTPASAYMQRTL